MINKSSISATIYQKYGNILDIDFLRCLYLIFGDGSYADKLYFSNKQPELHNYVIKIVSDCFEISQEIWKLRILHHENKDINLMQKVKNYWFSSLNFSEVQLYPTISYSNFRTAKQGNARVELGKRIYSKIIKGFITKTNFLINNSKLNQKQLLAILDGILNAEGSALIDKTGIHKIVITLNKNEKGLIKNVLKQLDMNKCFKESKQGKLVCSNWWNFYNFFRIWIKNDMQPFSLHPNRFHNAVLGFLNHKRTISLKKYVEVLDSSSKSFKEISEELNFRQTSVSGQIRKFREFFTIDGRGVNSHPYHVSLSEEGKTLSNIIRKLEVLKIKAIKLLNLYSEQLREYEVN